MTGRPASGSVDVIVGVHSDTRPIERVTASALAAAATASVLVVAHNTDPAGIRARLGLLADDPRVRIVPLADGVRSPANAYNRGLDAAGAEYVSIVGSDDEFAPGALDAWLALARDADADVVIAPVVRSSGGIGTTPRPRPRRTRDLDGDRDRLFERSAPLGLVRRARFEGLRLTPGLPRGEDQAYSLHLWFSGARVAFDPRTPPYIEHDDQGDRVTRAAAPLAEDLAFLDAVEADPVFQRMSAVSRRAFAAKTLRVFVLDAIVARLCERGLDEATRAALAVVLPRIRSWAKHPTRLLSRRDRAILEAALAGAESADRLRRLARRRGGTRSAAAIIPAAPWLILHRHAPLRSLLAHRRVVRAQREASGAP